MPQAAPSISSERQKRFNIRGKRVGGWGLRSQIIIVLGLVLLPMVIISCLWAFSQYENLCAMKMAKAVRSVERMAADVSGFLYNKNMIAAAQFPPKSSAAVWKKRCEAYLSDVMRERHEYSFAAVLIDDEVICLADIGSLFTAEPDPKSTLLSLRNRLRTQRKNNNNSVFLHMPGEDYLILGTTAEMPEESSEEEQVFLITALRTPVLAYAISATRLGVERGSALVSVNGDVITHSASPGIEGDWLPEDLTPLADFIVRLKQEGSIVALTQWGEHFRYFMAPTSNPDLLVLTGYPEALLFSSERSILWSSLAPMLLLLVVATIGTLLVTERLVVRWITYLQRVTRLYGSGRLSVRAVRIAEAPRELAELGMSFNEMATNVASYARQLEHAAVEKDTLLREIHHRVKNNFQVIASLLSLHKRTAETTTESYPESDGLRFIEDHVQAMSIAYRVGYSSGDMGETPLAELIHDVIDGLRRTAGVAESRIEERPPIAGYIVDLDQAVGIALYIAALLPAYLDAAKMYPPVAGEDDPKVKINAEVAAFSQASAMLHLTLDTDLAIPINMSPLQERLARAYIRQLKATLVENDQPSHRRTIIIPLETSSTVEANKKL